MNHSLKKEYLNKQYFATLNWAKEFDWKLKPNLNLEPFIDEKGLDILKDIFGYQYLSPIKLEYKNSGSKTISNKFFNEILNLKNKIILSQAVIDTRDPNKYI
jgi:RNAse (barnase) inhibitor barstar